MRRFRCDSDVGFYEEPEGEWVDAEEALAQIETLKAQLLIANRAADMMLDTNSVAVACQKQLREAHGLLRRVVDQQRPSIILLGDIMVYLRHAGALPEGK